MKYMIRWVKIDTSVSALHSVCTVDIKWENAELLSELWFHVMTTTELKSCCFSLLTTHSWVIIERVTFIIFSADLKNLCKRSWHSRAHNQPTEIEHRFRAQFWTFHLKMNLEMTLKLNMRQSWKVNLEMMPWQGWCHKP